MLRRFKLLPIIILAFLIFIVSIFHYAHAQGQPTIRLTSVDYPQVVSPGVTFNVTINAWYSDKFLSDVGLWDLNSGLIVESMTFISQFSGPGDVNFTLSLTAPKTLGTWHLLAINRVWWQNAWYLDTRGGEQSFNVAVASNLTLTLGSFGANAELSVDGRPYEIQNRSDVSTILTPGAHVLSAAPIIQPFAGQRYVFVGWSDGVNSNPHTIFLTESGKIYARFQTEYYLSAQSTVGQIAGGGWYANDTEATVAVAPLVTSLGSFGLTEGYRFTGWSGDNNSTSNVAVIMMDGPKQIYANWVDTGPVFDSRLYSIALLLCSLILLSRIVIFRLRRRDKTSSNLHRVVETKRSLPVLILALLILPSVFPLAHAQSLPQPRASLVRIADADWYYWAQPGSDTCLIWLGGGVPEQAEPGSYGYFINPFDYESFGTIRFIQDLASYYCVLALQQGSVLGVNPAANRTINQELFQPESATIEDVHTWIMGQGYVHTFIVGYSVGGQAAVADLTLGHPDDWTTNDGIILITVPITSDVLDNARELRANLFLIYGGNLLDYEATGIQFYNDTKAEGAHEGSYFHKEFHVINDAGHEVWTIRATGAYDHRALNLVISFIEKSKSLQVNNSLQPQFTNSTNDITANISFVQVPTKVNPGQAFLAESNVSFLSSRARPLILAAYTQAGTGFLSEVSLKNENGTATSATIVIPPISNSVKLVVSFVVFQNSGESWVQASNAYHTIVTVADVNAVTVQTSFPSTVFYFDGTQYSTNSSSLAEIQTVPGQHVVEAQPFIYLSNTSRLRFVGWGDLTNMTAKRINLTGDMMIEVSYVQQYLIQVDSTFGQTTGSGWYDANSTASAQVEPPILTSPPVMFSNWASKGNQSQVRVSFRVTGPVLISAVWAHSNGFPDFTEAILDPMLILSILTFGLLLMVNVKFLRAKHSSKHSAS